MTVKRISTDDKLYRLSTMNVHYEYDGGDGLIVLPVAHDFERILPMKAYLQLDDDPYLFYLDMSQHISLPPQWSARTKGFIAIMIVEANTLTLFFESFTGQSATLHFSIFIYGHGQTF